MFEIHLQVIYSVEDSAGNQAMKVVRTVSVVEQGCVDGEDVEAPELSVTFNINLFNTVTQGKSLGWVNSPHLCLCLVQNKDAAILAVLLVPFS